MVKTAAVNSYLLFIHHTGRVKVILSALHCGTYDRSVECFVQYCTFCQTNLVGYPAIDTENKHIVHTIRSIHYL